MTIEQEKRIDGVLVVEYLGNEQIARKPNVLALKGLVSIFLAEQRQEIVGVMGGVEENDLETIVKKYGRMEFLRGILFGIAVGLLASTFIN